ncbi:uncharacterized protein Dvir_GJ26375, isoform B [Drosophila virilis]|uniref:Uncharacterized protein, isoform B n=1 Tax=Drosophila virilis TaxID=7244 RepID=A0A0Q9W6M3_DROVI|nr:uncharacterized protein Dvir_GJ26375, isoform B [Drosophila virilis]
MVLGPNEKPTGQKLYVSEVLGVKRIMNKFSYLVLLEDQTTELLTSEVAKELCPKQIIHFYMNKCQLDGGQIHVPQQYNIEMESNQSNN